MKRYSTELYDKVMEKPVSRIEKEFGTLGLLRAALDEELKRDPEYIKKIEFLKIILKGLNRSIIIKNLIFGLNNFLKIRKLNYTVMVYGFVHRGLLGTLRQDAVNYPEMSLLKEFSRVTKIS